MKQRTISILRKNLTKKGFVLFLSSVKYAKQQLVLGSLTGGYEKEVANLLSANGYNVHMAKRTHE
jgi:hypothetical protein